VKKKKTRALVLISNGLDSRLALLMLKEQLGGENVEALHFILPFAKGDSSDKTSVMAFAREQQVKLHLTDCTRGRLLNEYIKILKNPKYGRGAALNPCIDCRVFMFKKAKKIAKDVNAEIIVTGEVAGERPMSQKKRTMRFIEKRAGLEGKVLRPLSAKVLSETDAEKEGLIDRNLLEGIEGRQRMQQIEMATKFGISYPTPSGGCLLCEKEFCKKIAPLLEMKKKLNELDIELLKTGRHFETSSIVLGRDRKENERLRLLSKKHKEGLLIIPAEPGPTAFIRKKAYEKKAKELIKKYSKRHITSFKMIKFSSHLTVAKK
jgi:tRNA-uridine 2-sulfurtransferase